MSSCAEFFATHLYCSEKCKKLQEIPNEQLIDWENQKAVPISPCVVQNEETLVRQLFNPIHIDKLTKTLKPTALDDIANKGLSVNRLQYTTESDITLTGNTKAERDNTKIEIVEKKRSLAGLSYLQCYDIRAITHITNDQSYRAFAVYDTSLSNDSSHADVCQIFGGGKQIERSLRSKLFEKAKDNVKLFL